MWQRAVVKSGSCVMTQAELASRSGMSLSSYKRFEQTGEIAFSSLCRVADILDSLEDIEALFSWCARHGIHLGGESPPWERIIATANH